MIDEKDTTLLIRVTPKLRDYIYVDDGILLAELLKREALTPTQFGLIKGEVGNRKQVGKMVDYILKGDGDVVDKFIHSLRASGLGSVVTDFLRQPVKPDTWKKDEYNPKSEDQKLLIDVRRHLMENLDIEDGELLTELKSRWAITQAHVETIKALTGDSVQTGKLLDILGRGAHDDAVDKLIYSMRAIGQKKLAKTHLREPEKPDKWTEVEDDSASTALKRKMTDAQPISAKKSRTEAPAPVPVPDSDYGSEDEDFDVSDEVCDIDVKDCEEDFFKTHRNEAYRMDKKYRGKVLIVNVKKVAGSKPRAGTDVDRDNLQQLFGKLHMDVTVFNDEDGLSAKEIEEKVNEFASPENHVHSQCCVLALLSHGEEGHILGTDGKKVNVDKLRSHIKNCDTLIGKPKLAIFQACRGSRKDDGVDHPLGEDEADDLKASHGDEVVGFPTQAGYKSWRNTEKGSWYVSALVYVFRKHAHHKHVVDMLTMVNRVVSRKVTKTLQWEDRDKTQMSEFRSTLIRPFFLFPGIIKDDN